MFVHRKRTTKNHARNACGFPNSIIPYSPTNPHYMYIKDFRILRNITQDKTSASHMRGDMQTKLALDLYNLMHVPYLWIYLPEHSLLSPFLGTLRDGVQFLAFDAQSTLVGTTSPGSDIHREWKFWLTPWMLSKKGALCHNVADVPHILELLDFWQFLSASCVSWVPVWHPPIGTPVSLSLSLPKLILTCSLSSKAAAWRRRTSRLRNTPSRDPENTVSESNRIN